MGDMSEPIEQVRPKTQHFVGAPLRGLGGWTSDVKHTTFRL